jgi:copper chaperone CopZ
MISVVARQSLARPPIQERALIRELDFSCAGESAGLERRLRRVPGVSNVAVNPVNEIAYVTFDPNRTNLAELEFVVSAAGFRVR